MRSLPSILALVSLALAAQPAAAAGIGGPWRVMGQVSDRPFSLDCRFEPKGAGFGGVCIEVAGGDSKSRPASPTP